MTLHPLNPLTLFLAGFDWRGTSSRAIYWAAVVWFQVPSLILVGLYQGVPWQSAGRIAAFVVMIVLGFVVMGHIVRRVRHIGWHGAWAIVSVVPIVGLIFGIVIGILKHGTPRPPGKTLVVGYGAMAVFSLALLIFALKFGTFWIPSGSMKPGLLIGDFVIAVRTDDVAPGDVIVFKNPKTGAAFVKRLIATEGDVITFGGQVPTVNGTTWPHDPMPVFVEPYRRASALFPEYPRCANRAMLDEPCEKLRWKESQPGGISYPILTVSDMPRLPQNTHFQVQPGYVFVMGDNRDNSNDSRMPSRRGLGMVPVENIEFRVELILVNFLTFDRFFKGVR